MSSRSLDLLKSEMDESEDISEQLRVEVFIFGSYYKGYVNDIVEQKLCITFEEEAVQNWTQEMGFTRFHFYSVRLPPLSNDRQFNDGDQVEVYLSIVCKTFQGLKVLKGWRRGTILYLQESVATVALVADLSSMFFPRIENVDVSCLRHCSCEGHIKSTTFIKFEVLVPEPLREYAKIKNVHKNFQKLINAAICRYQPETGMLSCISRHAHSKERVLDLIRSHFSSLENQVFQQKSKSQLPCFEFAKRSTFQANNELEAPEFKRKKFMVENARCSEMSIESTIEIGMANTPSSSACTSDQQHNTGKSIHVDPTTETPSSDGQVSNNELIQFLKDMEANADKRQANFESHLQKLQILILKLVNEIRRYSSNVSETLDKVNKLLDDKNAG